MRRIFNASLALLCLAGSARAQEAATVGEVNAIGNRRIETATILNAAKTQPGEPLSAEKIRQDIKAIYATGFFQDVQVDVTETGGKATVTFIVKEKPSIKEILIQGNEEIKEDKIREKLDIKPLTIMDQAAVDRNVGIIENLYKEDGFYLVEVTAEEETISENWVRVLYKIKEGPEIHIQNIVFTGNNSFTKDELEDVMETKAHWFMSWLTGSGKLKNDVLNQDLDKLLSFYYDHGFLDAQTGTPKIDLNEDRTELTITIPITEGVQYTLTGIKLAGNHILTTPELMAGLKSKTGVPFARQDLREDIQWITEQYAQQGYLLTQVYPSLDKNAEARTVAVTINIQEGKLTFVGRITITGNKSTRDKVIRRELRFAEGDILTSEALKRSYQKVNTLGFFDAVNIKTPPGTAENELDIAVDVKERLTGSLSVGAGWSSVNQLVGNVSISEGNLFGRGQRLTLAGTFGAKTQSYNLGFTEPYLFDTRLSGGFDLYFKTRNRIRFQRYIVDRKGGNVTFGYSMGDFTQLSFSYLYEIINIHDVASDAPEVIRNQEGEIATSAITLALVRDSRNDRFRPTSGSRNRISVEYAGDPLGGDNNFTKFMGETGWHIPLFWRFVLSLHGTIGYITSHHRSNIPVTELFIVGGDLTVRGFQNGSLGPKIGTDVIGGNKELFFNAELHFPLVDPLSGLIFYDMGNAWGEDQGYELNELRKSAGVGVRFFTPIGPIRLDWGHKLDQKKGESTSEWHFAVGTYF